MRYGIYTRKSDDDRSVTEKSIGEQVVECTHIAERNGLQVFRTWEESRSAKTPNRRAGYKELISLIERGTVEGIICWHVNRLVRNMEEGGKLAQLLIEGKIKEIRTPSAIYRTGDNIMPLVIEAASATQFSLDHSKTVSRGMEGSFRAGGCINAAPQGYRNSRDPMNLKKGIIERDPERFETIRRGWNLLLVGTHSVKQVTDTMNRSWGFRTRQTKKGGNRPLSYTGAYFLFTNPFYAGFVRYKGEIVKGNHEPMITADEYMRAQQILQRRSFAAPRFRDYAYTGLMHCAYCGQQITGEIKRLRDGRLWENYHCADSRLECTKTGLSRSKVEERIGDELDSLDIRPSLLQLAYENILRSLGVEAGGSTKILEAQETALQQVTERLARLDEMWLNGITTDQQRYRELEDRELSRKNEILTEIQRIKDETQRMHINLERGRRYLKEAKEELKVASDARRKEICRALATRYTFDGRKKTVQIEIHPLLVEMVSFARKLGGLEPHVTGSESRKEPTFEKPVLIGGAYRRRLEPPVSLLATLKGECFPDLWSNDKRSTIPNERHCVAQHSRVRCRPS